jgi:hypothetical protein
MPLIRHTGANTLSPGIPDTGGVFAQSGGSGSAVRRTPRFAEVHQPGRRTACVELRIDQTVLC